ncbi:MAG TPA: peptidylprolyl isomerase [Bryobacteraceae bacterium]|nr:peptidylprolyl isomerase [Bryobacteraceae bacterium]
MRPFYTLSLLATILVSVAAGQATHSTAPARHTAPKAAAPALPEVALPSEPGLYAVIYTSMGNIVCRLYEHEAPNAVANFRGLATGAKTWTNPKTAKPMHTPLYSGTTFHRVIPDFMIQGGDPAGDGTGFPGYEFEDEINPDRKFDHPGVLAMANHGRNTNGSQFFITVAPAEHLNGGYTVFGEVVSGQDVADAISKVPRDSNDKPLTPVVIKAIAIHQVGSSSGTATPGK